MKDWFLIVCLFLIMGISFYVGYKSATERNPVADTTRVVLIDTLFYDEPKVRDSVVVRYVNRKMATAAEPQPAEKDGLDYGIAENSTADSVEVKVPITQKVYEDSTYTAWVSGYEPRLDSIAVRQRTIKEVITQPVVKKQSRFGFGVGVGVGYGLTTRKPDIFAGVMFTYRFN